MYRGGKHEAPQISHEAIPPVTGQLCKGGTALPRVGSMGQMSQGRRFQRHSAPHQQHRPWHSLLVCAPGHVSCVCATTFTTAANPVTG